MADIEGAQVLTQLCSSGMDSNWVRIWFKVVMISFSIIYDYKPNIYFYIYSIFIGIL